MHVAKFYSERHQTAYVVLGHCTSTGEIMQALERLENEIQQLLPAKVELNEIAAGQWAGMTIAKFQLYEVNPTNEGEPVWLPVENHIHDLKPKFK